MEYVSNNINYKFTPTHICNIIKIKKILDNDVFKKYEISANTTGELIVCKDISKLKSNNRRIVRETYEEYLDFISKRDIEKDRWIYNIIDGISEQDKILYRDNLCIIIPNYKWNGQNIEKLHILSLPIDKTIRCLRDLKEKHIILLEHMKDITIKTINQEYGLDKDQLKIFIHYDPSTYHLHMHFVNINHQDCHSSVEYSHEINSVIFNLKMNSNYYQSIILNKL